eukprot:TRINITY_DN2186_c0_g1_i1.p1 TRINITY_DN2186_c0_g1~~TRINITY_DN2186_c0_g1_i1.p1  ORF type:complete len:375 (+),score=85.70 TRINITY_DN2186_c0_g1_i1:52-1125(+)
MQRQVNGWLSLLLLSTLVVLSVIVLKSEAKPIIKPVAVEDIPDAYLIPNVPYFRQLTDFTCGDASLEMVLSYYGPEVDQFSIIDAARTTSDEGTLSYDVTRVGHFSALSSAVGDLYPEVAPIHGFPGHPLGYAAFDYDSQTPWLDQVKALVASNIPVICLMHYSHDDPGGHFRVVVGYNDTAGNITLHDPWDYDENPPIAIWTYENFTSLWNYTENNSPRKNPFMGAAIYPWIVNAEASTNGTTSVVSVDVSYPCFAPFNCSLYEASNVLVNIELPENVTISIDQQQGVITQSLAAGESFSTKWIVTCGEDCSGQEVTITAQGIIQGWLPYTYKTYTVNYPPYYYIDAIGGTTTLAM